MEASRYFERTLFYDRSPDVDEYYENSADRIFEKDVSKVQIEVRLQPCSDGAQGQLEVEDNHYGKQRYDSDFEERKVPSVREASSGSIKQASSISIMKNQRSTTSNIRVDMDDNVDADDDGSSMISLASSTALPSAMDQRQGECDPPLYPGLPKLAKHYLAPGDIETFVKATKSDFRIFYLRQRHSFSQLQITKEAFERLLIACRVFPRFNEYVIELGRKKNETEVGPPPLKYRSICTTTSNLWRGFECSYILRYVEKTDRPGGRHPWSLRQFAVYHRFKPASSSQCSTWILVGASKRTELRLDRYTRSVDDVYQANPFELHVIFLDTVIANWRPYLAYLGRLVQEQSGRSSGYSEEDDFVTIEVEDHQQLKQIEDWMADLLLCLDSTMDTLTTFMDMYEDFRQQQNSHRHSSASSDIIAVAFQTKAKEIAYTRKKAESLLSRIQNTRTLVSSLLERQSGRNINQQIQALQKLEQQGQNENAIMRDLAEKNARDSSSMRILTIITMVYLPCTIVSNFYSTQFVNQVETRAGHMTLEYTSNAWIFFAISIPLTFFTIFVWFLWVNSDSMVRLLRDKHSRKMFQSTHFFRVRRSLDKLPQ